MIGVAANLYSDMREEARDHARVRNAYFDQVCAMLPFVEIQQDARCETCT